MRGVKDGKDVNCTLPHEFPDLVKLRSISYLTSTLLLKDIFLRDDKTFCPCGVPQFCQLRTE
jgi:hypothetical protein